MDRGPDGADPSAATGAPYAPVVELAVGARGYGKTWRIRERASELLDAGAYGVFAHDPWGAYPVDGLAIGARGDGWAVLNSPDEWNGERVASFRRCDAQDVAEFVRELGQPAVLVVDEMDLICRHTGWFSEAARDVVHYGRHLGISMLGSARRFSNVHQDLIALANRIYIFRLTGPRDLALVSSHWGDQWAAVVAALPKPPAARRHYLIAPDDLEQHDDPQGDQVALAEPDPELPHERTDRV